MLPLTLTQLRYVVEIDRHRHFGAAAEACHVTQPTLSMQVQKAEDLLGVTLFDRSRKPVQPTDIGTLVIQQARRVLTEADTISELIAEMQDVLAGPFSLGVIPTLSPYVIPWFVGSFSEAYPKVHLRIVELQTQDMIDWLLRDDLDAGLLVTPLSHSAIREEPLFYEPFVTYLSAGHPLLALPELRDSDLKGHHPWLLAQGHCFRDQAISVCGDRLSAQSTALRFESGTLETLIRLVDQGMGMTLLPLSATLELAAEAKLRIRPFVTPAPFREVSMVFARTQLRRRIARALHACIAAHLPERIRSQRPDRIIAISSPT